MVVGEQVRCKSRRTSRICLISEDFESGVIEVHIRNSAEMNEAVVEENVKEIY